MLDALRASRDKLLVQTRNVDAFGGVVVRGWDDFDDFVAGELEVGNVGCGTGHEVAVENAEDGFVGDD